MAHIVAETDTGPRANPAMPVVERNSYENLILLCPTDHSRVDGDVNTWTVPALHQIKQEHEKWVSERLAEGAIDTEGSEALRQLARVIERTQALPGILYADIGNARFLDALQKSDKWIWLRLNADKAFRDGYLTMLEEQTASAWQNGDVPFHFEMLDGLVVFPDGYEEYKEIFPHNPVASRGVPFYVTDTRLIEVDRVRCLVHQKCIDIPWIPRENGFIQKRDSETGLPSVVTSEPAEKEWGAYYWVRASGCRIVVGGIGILDPMEVGGCALWWGPRDTSPLLGVRPAKVLTTELREEMNEALQREYLRFAGERSPRNGHGRAE